MAETALTKTLDDLINESKKSKSKAPRGGKEASFRSGSKDSALGVSKGGVGKGGRGKDARRGFKVGGGRGGAPRVLVARKDPDGSGKWEHDLYQEGPRGGRGRGAGRISTDATLFITNLHYDVTDEDIKELFIEFSSVKKCSINYDQSGRSMGEATVVFSSKEEALRAKRRYTDMALDGQVMKLELVEGGPVGGRGPKTLSSGIRLTAAGSGRQRRGGGSSIGGGSRAFAQAFRSIDSDDAPTRRGRGRSRGGRGGRGGGQLGDLDAELNDYMKE